MLSKKNLTPRCKSLYADGLRLKKRLQYELKKIKNFKSRLHEAENITDKFIDKKLSSKMSVAATLLTKLQIRETSKKLKGRRFTNEEKLLSLSLYKRSPKSYRLLSKLFTLPGKKTLCTMLSKVKVDTGINQNVLNALKENVKNLQPNQRYCVLMFDEVFLSTELHYDSVKGKINGFEDDGFYCTQKLADHALVFMIRGIIKQYKQPLSYTFCNGATHKYILAKMIKDSICSIYETGLEIIATVCDQGTTNEGAYSILINDTKSRYLKQNKSFSGDFFEVLIKKGEVNKWVKIIPLYDPPHLIKGVRNNL